MSPTSSCPPHRYRRRFVTAVIAASIALTFTSCAASGRYWTLPLTRLISADFEDIGDLRIWAFYAPDPRYPVVLPGPMFFVFPLDACATLVTGPHDLYTYIVNRRLRTIVGRARSINPALELQLREFIREHPGHVVAVETLERLRHPGAPRGDPYEVDGFHPPQEASNESR